MGSDDANPGRPNSERRLVGSFESEAKPPKVLANEKGLAVAGRPSAARSVLAPGVVSERNELYQLEAAFEFIEEEVKDRLRVAVGSEVDEESR